MTRKLLACALVLAAAPLAGCSKRTSSGTGTLDFLLEAEDTVAEGLAAGEGAEDIRDGWSASWDNYIVTIGHVKIVSAVDEMQAFAAEERFVVDLTEVPSSGLSLWSFDGVKAGRWNVFYETGEPELGAMRDPSVDEVDFTQVVDGDLTYLIRGTIESVSGQSCPPAAKAVPGEMTANANTNSRDEPCYDNKSVGFEIAIEAGALFGPCKVDEMPGTAVPSGGSQSAALTIHGDHMFFNGFPEGEEGGVMRRAQWLADADLNVDGNLTQAELESLSVSDMATFDQGYQFGGAPEGALENLWTYLAAQLKSQGHFQGEGECAVEGVLHGHEEK